MYQQKKFKSLSPRVQNVTGALHFHGHFGKYKQAVHICHKELNCNEK
jgi:hypothetical protein